LALPSWEVSLTDQVETSSKLNAFLNGIHLGFWAKNYHLPSKLAVATSSVLRLVKEEASYHKELEQQQARIEKVEAHPEEENADYNLKQLVRIRMRVWKHAH
jgi:hypothetical protein